MNLEKGTRDVADEGGGPIVSLPHGVGYSLIKSRVPEIKVLSSWLDARKPKNYKGLVSEALTRCSDATGMFRGLS